MTDNLKKLQIYFQKDIFSYWKLTENTNTSNLGKYPISIKQRIIEGHYPSLNRQGLPFLGDICHYTTICSFGLGNHEIYCDEGLEKALLNVFNISNFLTESINDNGAFIQSSIGNHKDGPSAMIQGEAISLLLRAYELSGNELYLDTALKAIGPFNFDILNGGVVSNINNSEFVWYEEYTDQPLNHVLNGFIYSLWGLYDLHKVTGNSKVKMLFDDGVNSLIANLNLFDSGYWSYYWHTEQNSNYIASLMYHNLHICQLKYLDNIYPNNTISKYRNQFEDYSKSYFNRFRSGVTLLYSKLISKVNR